MRVADAYTYAVLRVVPDVVREEFINVGVVVFCEARDFLAASTRCSAERLRALAPAIDLALVEAHVAAIVAVCAGEGPLGALPRRERFKWIVAPRSDLLQASATHAGLTEDPAATLERLLARVVIPR